MDISIAPARLDRAEAGAGELPAGAPAAPYSGTVDLTVSRHRIVTGLAATIALLTALSAFFQVLKHGFGYDHVLGLVNWLYLGEEANPPTWYQTAAFLLAALLAGAVSRGEQTGGGRYARHWLGLALILAYLSLDEGGKVHERLVEPLQHLLGFMPTGAWVTTWIIVALPAVALVGLVYLRFFFLHLSPRERIQAALAAAVFVAGAVGIEMLTGWLMVPEGGTYVEYGALVRPADEPLISVFLVHLEEAMEMIGLLIFIDLLLGRLQTYRPLRIGFGR